MPWQSSLPHSHRTEEDRLFIETEIQGNIRVFLKGFLLSSVCRSQERGLPSPHHQSTKYLNRSFPISISRWRGCLQSGILSLREILCSSQPKGCVLHGPSNIETSEVPSLARFLKEPSSSTPHNQSTQRFGQCIKYSATYILGGQTNF